MPKKLQSGFTIVELLVVIVVIGILAAISIVAYNGVMANAEKVTIQSDLKNASSQLELAKIDTNNYPATADALKKSNGTEFVYTLSNGNYCLTAQRTNKPAIVYNVSSTDPSVKAGACPAQAATAASCFAFSAGIISDYYTHQNNNSSNPACPRAVVIPGNFNGIVVQNIASYAFIDKQLTSVILPNSITEIGEYGFQGNALTAITLPSSLSLMGEAAFSANQITSVVIPASLTEIPTQAFFMNQITSVTIPSTVTLVGYNAFSDNNIANAAVPTGAVMRNNSFDSTTVVERY